MIQWGINALNHGSSLAVFENNELRLFTQCPTDELSKEAIYDAFNYGGPHKVYWYEQPWLKKARQIKAGQWHTAFDLNVIPSRYLKRVNIPYTKIAYTAHHASHAAAGYYTSPFNHCAIVVLDAIGEFECATIWEGKHGELTKVWSRSYPNSLGLFYSAFTDLIGLTPVRDEYKLQQLAELGDRNFYYNEVKDYFNGMCSLKYNLHKGVTNWPHTIYDVNRSSIAAAVQRVFEEQVEMIMLKAKELTGADCLVYMGGCAMNSTTNKKIVEPMWKHRWSLPNPGDPSSCVGAVLYKSKQRLWNYNFGVVNHLEISV